MTLSRVSTSPSRQKSITFPPPKTASAKPPRKALPHPGFEPLVEFLRLSLVPLVDCISGLVPADFPDTILAYQLLTHEQLDNLARFFQQTSPPGQSTLSYPVPMDKPWIGSLAETGVSLDTKRRRFGRFIGLKGCESPIVEARPFFEEPMLVDLPALPVDVDESALADLLSEIAADCEASLEVTQNMELEWQAALVAAQAERNSYGWK